jgi:prepilin-type N-terminal cleavage/methylation domain-containing protein
MMRERSIRADAGMTLVELMVAMTLLLGLSTMIVMFVSSTARVQIHTDDENRGLSDAKVILDRLARDIRSARAATCNDPAYLATLPQDLRDADLADPTCLYHLQLWVDGLGAAFPDYVQQANEIVTWRMEPNADGIHFDVLRYEGAAPPRLEASALVVRTLFQYRDGRGSATTPGQATVVRLNLEYDARAGIGTDRRWASVSVRLRNKG